MKYAVLDWDNTIRKGFTLFSWMDFLFKEQVISTDVRSKVEKVQEKYAIGEINHDNYARRSCELYSEAMKGITESERDYLVEQYMHLDRKSIFSFSREIFIYMNYHQIKPVIISGAPYYILRKYSGEFGLDKIYSFTENYDNGICTGKVAYNYGMNKGETISQLCELYGEKPIMGFGDSYSDKPLFDIPLHSYCIVDNLAENDKPYGDHVMYISNEISIEQMKIILENSGC